MRLLLIESTPGNAREINDRLTAAGHEVVMCADAHGPCRGVTHHEDCPIEHHTDLTLVAREAGTSRSLDEMGSVCSARHHIPVVELDPRDPDAVRDLPVTHALASRAVRAAYANAVRSEIREAEVTIERSPDLVHVTLRVPPGTNVSAVADRARKVVREHDPYVRGIDVSVVTAD